MCMSAQAPEQDEQRKGEDTEVTWINELAWNDTLQYLNLDSSYFSLPEGTESDKGLTSNRSSWSTFSELSLPSKWTHSESCLVHNNSIESGCAVSHLTSCESLAGSDNGYTADLNDSESELTFTQDWFEDDIGTMYDNVTDDYKINLRSKSVPVKVPSARTRLNLSPKDNRKIRSMGSQSVSPNRHGRACCDQDHSPKLKRREKRTDFLRKSSPSSLSNSTSTSTSNSSIPTRRSPTVGKSPSADNTPTTINSSTAGNTPTNKNSSPAGKSQADGKHSRKTRSLSPRTHQQEVINRLHNPVRCGDRVTTTKKVYRDCCSRHYQQSRDKHEFLRARTRSNPVTKKVINSSERSKSFHSGANNTKSPVLAPMRSSSHGVRTGSSQIPRPRSLSAGVRVTSSGLICNISHSKPVVRTPSTSKSRIATSTPKSLFAVHDVPDSASPILHRCNSVHEGSPRSHRTCDHNHHHTPMQRRPVQRDFLRAGSKKPSSIKKPMTSSSNYNLPHHDCSNVARKINYKTPPSTGSPKGTTWNTKAKNNKDIHNNDIHSSNSHVHKTPTESPSSPLFPLSSPSDDLRTSAASLCDEVLLEFPTLYYKLDCSGEAADIDLESRRQKAGTVYRILDNGLVVCESHPEITDDLIPQSPSDSGECSVYCGVLIS